VLHEVVGLFHPSSLFAQVFPVPKHQYHHSVQGRAFGCKGVVDVVVEALEFPLGAVDVRLREQVILYGPLEEHAYCGALIGLEGGGGIERPVGVVANCPGGGSGELRHDIVLWLIGTMCRKLF
jgi:hypothetical protein